VRESCSPGIVKYTGTSVAGPEATGRLVEVDDAFTR